MSITTNSKLDEKITYENEEESEPLAPEDEGLESDIYKINIFGDLYLIAPGNVKIHPSNNKLAYLNVYILLNKKVSTKIGVYEKLIDDETVPSDITNKNFGIENMELLLFQKFYSQRYRLQPLMVNELDIQNLQRELSSVNEESTEQEGEKQPADSEPEAAEDNEQGPQEDDLDRGLYQEEETKEEENTKLIKLGIGITLESNKDKTEEDLKELIKGDLINTKALELMEAKKELPEEKFFLNRIRVAKKLLSEITVNSINAKHRREYYQLLDKFNKKIVSDVKYIGLFKNMKFDMNAITLTIIEIVYNIKFILVDEDTTMKFSLLPDFESNPDGLKDSHIERISDGDPHFFIFVEKRDNQYVPLNIMNKSGEMVNMVTIDSMTDALLESLKKSYQEFNTSKNMTNMYKLKDHFKSLKMVSGGKLKPKLKLKMMSKK